MMQKRRRDDNYSQARDENEVARQGPSKGGPSRNNSQNVGGYVFSDVSLSKQR